MKPIIFTGESVKAILAGSKTQTRRVLKVKGDTEFEWSFSGINANCEAVFWSTKKQGTYTHVGCPYNPGEKLWVRETWTFLGTDMLRHGRTHPMQDGVIKYAADGVQESITTAWQNVEKWMAKPKKTRPSIHMERWMSRLTLEIKSVRVERLQEITFDDVIAEGVNLDPANVPDDLQPYYREVAEGIGNLDEAWAAYARAGFAKLWDKTNKKHPWADNPFVFVIEFSKAKENHE